MIFMHLIPDKVVLMMKKIAFKPADSLLSNSFISSSISYRDKTDD